MCSFYYPNYTYYWSILTITISRCILYVRRIDLALSDDFLVGFIFKEHGVEFYHSGRIQSDLVEYLRHWPFTTLPIQDIIYGRRVIELWFVESRRTEEQYLPTISPWRNVPWMRAAQCRLFTHLIMKERFTCRDRWSLALWLGHYVFVRLRRPPTADVSVFQGGEMSHAC